METCPICLESITDNITKTNCNHNFCNACFDELLNKGKIECPMCRSVIKEYSNNEEKVRILVKHIRVNVENEGINISLLNRREIQRRNFRNYVYTVIFLYTIYSYVNCSFMFYNLKDAYNKCIEDNSNYTNIIEKLTTEGVSVSIYDYSIDKISKFCMIPTYFYERCFSL